MWKRITCVRQGVTAIVDASIPVRLGASIVNFMGDLEHAKTLIKV